MRGFGQTSVSWSRSNGSRRPFQTRRADHVPDKWLSIEAQGTRNRRTSFNEFSFVRNRRKLLTDSVNEITPLEKSPTRCEAPRFRLSVMYSFSSSSLKLRLGDCCLFPGAETSTLGSFESPDLKLSPSDGGGGRFRAPQISSAVI